MAEKIQIRLEGPDCGRFCIKDKKTGEPIVTMNVRRDGAGNLCLECIISDSEAFFIEGKDGKALPKPYKRLW